MGLAVDSKVSIKFYLLTYSLVIISRVAVVFALNESKTHQVCILDGGQGIAIKNGF